MATGDGRPDAGARFRPEGQHELGPSGQVARITANITAIKTLRRIQDEGRPAAPGEQAFLARWSGWGAVPQIFDEGRDQFADARAELRALLTEDEWVAARRTTMNAHYTDAAIVRAMWDAVTGLGFEGGAVLEPGCGSGNFLGFAPAPARMLGIELDPVTAGIAAALYPDAEIRNESFADSRLPQTGFDLVIGNVPFSSAILTDPRHNQGRHSMHNHFLVKSLALTRPGGLIAALTSRYTMDAQDDSARREMAAMADLVTAIRLPSGAHRKAAGTEAVTDLMVFRRRADGQRGRGADWERAFATELEGGTARVSEYFKDHPENVLGHLAVDGGQYSSEELIVRPRADLARVPEELADRLAAESARAHEAQLVMSPRSPAQKTADIRAGGGRVSMRIVAREASRFEGTITASLADGTFTVLRNGDAEPWPCPASQQPELRALLRLRDSVAALLEAENASSDDTPRIGELRARLNREYDSYKATYGPLNRMSWRRTGRTDSDGNETWSRQVPAQGGFRQDPYAAIVYALEDYDPETGTASKAAIFTQRVISPREPATSAETPADAIAICMDAAGEIRLEQVARLLGLESEDEARAALGELAYDDPATGRLVPAPEYLSGKVRDKLAEAEKAAKADPRFGVNVAALRRVLPADLGPGDIDARLGASWIPPALVQQGLREILQDPGLTVTKGHGTTWSVSGTQESVLAREVYGTGDKDAISLAQALLEQRPIKVSYSMDDLDREDRARLDAIRDRRDMQAFIRARSAAATVTARAKADELSEKFTEWLWADPARSAELTSLYNKRFNSLVLRSYDDVRPRLPGLAGWFKPHPHQYAAVARIINEPAALLAHEVGAGKTAEMAMGAMELRRLGLVSKPAIVVPNHMLEQFQREFLQLYPQAKVLACGARDLEKDRRHAFVARIATGDWDAVIMSRSVFERIPMSAAEQQRYIRNKLKAYDEWLERAAAETDNPRMIKRMESQRLSFEERLKRKLVKTRDAGISFEQTGIDYLFIDEAHGFKNLDTRSNNPSLDIDGSGRASDLEMKVDYLRRGRGKRVCTFATATPIANSMTEAYVMTRYLRPDLLADAGIEDFDGWVGSFASTVTDVEVAPEGGLRVKERVASFRNIPELLLMWRVFSDVKTADDLKLPVPELAGGKPEVVTVPPSAELKLFMLSLASRAEAVRSGRVDPKDDNMLKISSDGRAAALDLRLIGRRAPANGKIDIAADRIASIYADTKDSVYHDQDGNPELRRGALQIVFCELGTPTGQSAFGTYEYLRGQLAARGVPASQVRFMHEAKNDKDKAQLFADARAGKVSVLIGTTELMGVGTNVQKRAIALHHLDCPWRPADVAQREGRIIRQKNQNPRVQIIRYVTEGSFDAYMWQTVLRKAKFIAQIMKGSVDSREIEDIGGSDTLSYSEVTALATGDMRILAKAKADADVVRLTRLESSWRRSQRHLKESIGENERQVAYLQEEIAALEPALARRTNTRGDAFHCQLGGQVITKRTDTAAYFQETARRILAEVQQSWMRDKSEDGDSTIRRDLGTFGGLELQAMAWSDGFNSDVQLRFAGIRQLAVAVRTEDIESDKPPIGIVYRLENDLGSLDGQVESVREDIAHAQAEVERARAALGTPFSRAAELAHARSEADRLAAELGGQRVVPMAEPEAHETPVTDAQAAQEDQAKPAISAADQERETPEASTDHPETEEATPDGQDEEAEEDGWATPAAQAAPAPASTPATAAPGRGIQSPGPSLREIANAMGDRFQIIPIGFPPGKTVGKQDRAEAEATAAPPGKPESGAAEATAASQGRPQHGRDDSSAQSAPPTAAPAAQPAAVPTAGGRRPTAEQQAIVDACVSGQNLVIEAGAGTGKTSTLRMASAAMTGRTGLYVAYNKAIANEARGSFPANVTCATAHSLAFQAIGRGYAHRLNSKRLPAHEIAALLGIREPMQLGEEMLTPPQLAGIVMSTVGRFCHSADQAIASAHVPPVNGVTGPRRAQLTQLVVPLAVGAWMDLQRADGRLPFSHDHYLKMWQLTQPRLNADFVLFDEAQDADLVIAAIIQGQGGAQKIAVGDSCQAIYGWRGAVDALATWPADQRLYLSQSFRFGVPIAEDANKWLENLGAVLRLTGTPSIPSAIGTVTAPDAVLCRTNAEAVSQALTLLEQGRRVALVGGGDDIKRLAEAARELQQRGHTNHPELAAFRTWNAVQRYVRDDEGGADLATFVRLVDTHGPDAVIRTVDQLSSEDNADVVVSTAHKAKGREWNQVLIAPDFREPANKETGERGVIPRSDAMLAYVAVTRAKQRLDRGSLAWIDNYASGATAQGAATTAESTGCEQATVIPVAAAAEPQPAIPVAGQEPAPQPPAEPAAQAPALAPAASAGSGSAIRIEHDARGTRVYGTDRSQQDVISVLHDQGFKWSRNNGFWYLNSTWKYPTRGDRVRRLQARLDTLGIAYNTGAGQQQEMPVQPAPESQAASTESTSPAEAQASDAPADGAEDAPDAIADLAEPGYEQQSLFGTPVTQQPPAKASRPAAHKPTQQLASDAPAAKTPTQSAPEPTTMLPAEPATQPTIDTASGAGAAATTGSAAISESLASIPVDPRPYEGGRAQAMSGSLIIENDYRSWASMRAQAGDAALPDEHPRVRQFTIAWQRVTAKGLDDGPGPAAARYHALAHAAMALSSAIDRASNSRETEALDLIAIHARKHSVRLRATADRMFAASGQAGRYQGGRAQAETGSGMIEKDYRAWIRTGSPLEAARDPLLWQHARRTEKAWHEVRRHGVADGPAAAATRYRELADAAQSLADGYTVTLPSAALPSLLELAEHAWKHSTRLHATARAVSTRSDRASEPQVERCVAPGADAYGALPDGLATVTRQAYASQHRQPQRHSPQENGHEGNRNASALRQDAPQDRSRG